MRKYQLYTAILCVAAGLAAGGCAANAQAENLETTAQETTAPETTVEDTVVETVTGAIESMEESQPQLPQTYRVYGTLSKAENGKPMMEDIEEGSEAYAYIGMAMTMSLPPQTTAEMILVNIPADSKAPDYVEVDSMVTDGDSGESVLTTTEGVEYMLSEDCNIFPYLTRNIVTLDDLTQGRKCLVWSTDDNTAERIMVFAE